MAAKVGGICYFNGFPDLFLWEVPKEQPQKMESGTLNGRAHLLKVTARMYELRAFVCVWKVKSWVNLDWQSDLLETHRSIELIQSLNKRPTPFSIVQYVIDFLWEKISILALSQPFSSFYLVCMCVCMLRQHVIFNHFITIQSFSVHFVGSVGSFFFLL